MSELLRFPFKLEIPEALQRLEKSRALTLVNVGNAMAKSYVISQILEQTPIRNVLWASTDEKAESLHLNAELFLGDRLVMIPTDITLAKYYEILRHLESDTSQVFLFEDLKVAIQTELPTAQAIADLAVTLKKKQEIKIYEFFETLESLGYTSAEDKLLNPGEFVKQGDQLILYPLNSDQCYRVDFFGDTVEKIEVFAQQDQDFKPSEVNQVELWCADKEKFESLDGKLLESMEGTIAEKSCFIADDLDQPIDNISAGYQLKFTTFPDEKDDFLHLNFFSVLPFYTIPDVVTELKERMRREFRVVIMTKKPKELERIFRDNDIMFEYTTDEAYPSTLNIVSVKGDAFLPHSFQNNDQQILFLTDREIFQFKRSSARKKSISGMNFELMNSLKDGDYVVHLDHGIALYGGIVRRETGAGEIREYLKLEYLNNDRLFVPVDAAEKVTKYVGDDDPRLTKLGGTEWQNLQKKLKKETEKVAKELLQLYAKRELAKGKAAPADDAMMEDFNAAFPYELTPGQRQSWEDVRIDMEKTKPMDRLVCGDVGFGKTEIAMRAAFKAFRSGRQCAILAPITILAEQHHQSFMKRVKDKPYNCRIELLSRFQSAAEQKKILKDLEFGLVDIVIGTHRLLSDDVKFKDMGLVIIDEEQRFGVKQKEKLKKFRTNVDILTLTATPIPRTLHMGLNKLKDVSTITTPPPGRLPVVTEVRKYGLDLIRERIMAEVERGGQVYFLHNQVQTIESQTQQMRTLMPKVRFVVAHGQMSPHELEERIRQFKDGEADVLVASTIIENGIDLANANTLLVNRAEKFGLSQLYQLRGRVGRGRTQAYAFFLYQGQKLSVDAKKRLRAIVEASELGSGFQIAMKDLEIRGAGEILGANQAGAMKEAGVSHFVRMLNKTVEEMKRGVQGMEEETEENITVEVPLSAYIPPSYIPNADEKIQVYQEISGMGTPEELREYRSDLREDYGDIPKEVENLCRVIRLKMALKAAKLSGIRIQKTSHKDYEIILRLGQKFSPDQLFGLLQNSDQKWVVMANALKLELDKLPIGWYEDVVKAIELLVPPKKEKKEKAKK